MKEEIARTKLRSISRVQLDEPLWRDPPLEDTFAPQNRRPGLHARQTVRDIPEIAEPVCVFFRIFRQAELRRNKGKSTSKNKIIRRVESSEWKEENVTCFPLGSLKLVGA